MKKSGFCLFLTAFAVFSLFALDDGDLFYRAERSFGAGDYAAALAGYEDLIRGYPLSEHLPDAQFRLAQCHETGTGTPADPEAAEQAIRDAYDSTIYTGRVIENAWHTLRPLLPCMDAERRDLAIRQLSKTIATIQGEIAACL